MQAEIHGLILASSFFLTPNRQFDGKPTDSTSPRTLPLRIPSTVTTVSKLQSALAWIMATTSSQNSAFILVTYGRQNSKMALCHPFHRVWVGLVNVKGITLR